MILQIDTAQETGFVALSKDGVVLFSEENKIQKEHASWLHLAVNRIVAAAGITLRDLEAISVVAGPGSYTGLRVGMAAAKGFCYALKIPLITLNTLRVMAESMIEKAQEKNALICPLIDARRDEVFTALYQLTNSPTNVSPANGQRSTANASPANASAANASPSTTPRPTANGQRPTLTELNPPAPLIFDKNSFETELHDHSVIFFGSGAAKWEKICVSSNAIFETQYDILQAFARLTREAFDSQTWADPVYSEPVYLKEFFTY